MFMVSEMDNVLGEYNTPHIRSGYENAVFWYKKWICSWEYGVPGKKIIKVLRNHMVLYHKRVYRFLVTDLQWEILCGRF